MKKLIPILLVAFLLAGCQEGAKTSSETLLDPAKATSDFAKAWVKIYGSGPESVEHYNMVAVREVVNANSKITNSLALSLKGSIAETADQLDAITARLDELETKTDAIAEVSIQEGSVVELIGGTMSEKVAIYNTGEEK